mmetsp:Transcript_71334/g.195499  ORF Transcript_71334/g.195499 Transcript_71334/m.195499 type:complete len:213 (-) Transcript_71334:568-1206(-)
MAARGACARQPSPRAATTRSCATSTAACGAGGAASGGGSATTTLRIASSRRGSRSATSWAASRRRSRRTRTRRASRPTAPSTRGAVTSTGSWATRWSGCSTQGSRSTRSRSRRWSRCRRRRASQRRCIWRWVSRGVRSCSTTPPSGCGAWDATLCPRGCLSTARRSTARLPTCRWEARTSWCGPTVARSTRTARARRSACPRRRASRGSSLR